MSTPLGAAGLILACILGAGIGGYAGSTDPSPPDPVTTTGPDWADGCTTDANCAEMGRAITDLGWAYVGPAEDEPGWNCLTDGNGVCGPTWEPVTAELADALEEGEDPHHPWEACLVEHHDDYTLTVVCPDGYVSTP